MRNLILVCELMMKLEWLLQ